VNVTQTTGAGSAADWTINLAGPKGDAGTPGTTGAQTPWTTDIDGNGKKLDNALQVEIQHATNPNLLLTDVSTGKVAKLDLVADKIRLGEWGVSDIINLILSTLNVGIGTAAPGVLLHLKRDTAGDPASSGGVQTYGLFRLNAFNVGLDFGVYAGATPWMQAYNSFTDLSSYQSLVLQPLSGSKLGIGVAVPAYKVDVAGDVNITGTYRVGGTPISAGGFSTQNVVTGSRAIDTTYTNSGSTPMLVTASIGQQATSSGFVKTGAPPTTPPTTTIATLTNGSAVQIIAHITFIVMPGHKYGVFTNAGTLTVAAWVEWT
jgi:hypothetical protein